MFGVHIHSEIKSLNARAPLSNFPKLTSHTLFLVVDPKQASTSVCNQPASLLTFLGNAHFACREICEGLHVRPGPCGLVLLDL